jgi:hypothetical protein
MKLKILLLFFPLVVLYVGSYAFLSSTGFYADDWEGEQLGSSGIGCYVAGQYWQPRVKRIEMTVGEWPFMPAEVIYAPLIALDRTFFHPYIKSPQPTSRNVSTE